MNILFYCYVHLYNLILNDYEKNKIELVLVTDVLSF